MGKIFTAIEQAVKKHTESLVGKLVFLLFAGMMAGLFFFGALHMTLNAGLAYYFNNSSYLRRREARAVQELQNYITQKELTPYDSQELSKWVKDETVVYLEIYRNNRLLYASENWDDTILYETDTGSYKNKYHSLSFSDGDADIFLLGMYEYQFYTYALIAELLSGFFVSLLVFINGIRRGIQYIQDLRAEIAIMEGGCLERMIPVKGRDELAELAGGLEQLRCSLKENIENETALKQANQKLTTGIAHDLRTPLTALTMYVQILQSGVCKKEEKKQYYLDKIMSKAVQMKVLSDRLFEHSQMKDRKEGREQEEILTLQEAFMDHLSEIAMLLENHGFQIRSDLSWQSVPVIVRMDYLARIMDNICSNLIKYADPGKSVTFRIVCDDSMAGLEITNQIKRQNAQVESTRVGMDNIRHMMKQMNGICQVGMDQESYRIRILFPCPSLNHSESQPADSASSPSMQEKSRQ